MYLTGLQARQNMLVSPYLTRESGRINFPLSICGGHFKVTLIHLRDHVVNFIASALSFKREIARLPLNELMKERFLSLDDHKELANLFGLSYDELSKVIYKTHPAYKYHHFKIPKKNGGERLISSPSKKLKAIQLKLKDMLYEVYPTKTPVHGFAINKSIVTNAEKHLDKRYIFNLDLSDFFGSIHFGRVRNLFKSKPFNFNHSIATILAQICCFNNSLPQGAPTSPIISNMIAWKLDSQLQHLAKRTNSTYTRYADDISFSFTCNKTKLPEDIIVFKNDKAYPGYKLTRIIEENGFKINDDKVRLCSKLTRMEVTGLTVNEFPNVERHYIKQLSSMLHAWSKYGYEAAEKEYNEKYSHKFRASKKPKSYLYVIKGKLAFLRSVRTGRDLLFNKLATQFNMLVEEKYKFKILEITDSEQNAINSLWVIESCYDDEKGECKVSQGTGFQLHNVGIVTCAHVVMNDEKLLENIEVYKFLDTKKYKLKVDRVCSHRDVAICSILETGIYSVIPTSCIEQSVKPVNINDNVKLLGFPAYAPGHSYSIFDSKISKTYVTSTIKKFEIAASIREGNSGGPVIDAESKVVGIALEGATKSEGHNGCLVISEIHEVLISEHYIVN